MSSSERKSHSVPWEDLTYTAFQIGVYERHVDHLLVLPDRTLFKGKKADHFFSCRPHVIVKGTPFRPRDNLTCGPLGFRLVLQLFNVRARTYAQTTLILITTHKRRVSSSTPLPIIMGADEHQTFPSAQAQYYGSQPSSTPAPVCDMQQVPLSYQQPAAPHTSVLMKEETTPQREPKKKVSWEEAERLLNYEPEDGITHLVNKIHYWSHRAGLIFVMVLLIPFIPFSSFGLGMMEMTLSLVIRPWTTVLDALWSRMNWKTAIFYYVLTASLIIMAGLASIRHFY
ncbi:hypothetical protein PROFUN_14100 [Planoprotostelium fungivorum]|uniref:Uncharacterized protein n=1 Tax=Planoprotostelium fungivorum TaxID=1890364 RepID=A0A2P6N223_9EUKA|nr:hypothetical protein PROFUN_14100 [Planoprotostelium fungivorum]